MTHSLTGTFINTQRSEAELGVGVRYVLELCVAVDELWWTESLAAAFVLKCLACLHHKKTKSSSAD